MTIQRMLSRPGSLQLAARGQAGNMESDRGSDARRCRPSGANLRTYEPDSNIGISNLSGHL